MSSSFVGEAGTRPDDVPFGEKMEDKDWLERSDHPLLNDVILKAVLGHVRRYDLNACRGVCKKWNEHTIPHMRSTFQVTIHGSKYTEQNSETRRMVDFVKLFKSNELGLPYEKYRLGNIWTTDGDGKQFLEICGESIKELVLFGPGGEQIIENVSQVLQFSPKLEALTLSGRFVSLHRDVKLFPAAKPVLSVLKKLTVNHESLLKYCPTFFEELLSVASNISHITIKDMDYDGKVESCVVSSVLNSIERLENESSIQSLSLETRSIEHFEILKRMAEKPNGLKLKEISFKSQFTGPDKRTTVQLAEMFKDTLEEFNVIDESPGIHLMEFPKMAKLKTFKFSVMKDFGNKPVNLNYIFPVIETLSIVFRQLPVRPIGNVGVIDPVELFSEFQVCPTIHTLIMNVRGSFRSFHNISRVFPNLRKLTLSVTGEITEQVLLQIWAEMTQLESLSLLGYFDYSISMEVMMKLDSLVTGIPIEGLNQIRHVIPALEKMTVRERSEKILNLVEEHRTQQPSIRNLTNLRHLKLGLSTGYDWKQNNLSDLSGYFGIYLMKRLSHLDMQYCQFTKTCSEILTKEIGVEAWSFQTEEPGLYGYGSNHIIPPFPTPSRDEDDYN